MSLNLDVYRVAHEADISGDKAASLSAQDTYTPAILVAEVNRRITYFISGTWGGTVTLQKAAAEAGPFSDVAGKTYTGNIGATVYNDGATSGDAWYRLGFKTGQYSSGTAVCTLRRCYSKNCMADDRIAIVDDPTGKRGKVIRLFRNTGDAFVSGAPRVEYNRDAFSSEYAYNTGGGWYWTSYMFGTEWIAAVESGALDWGANIGNSKSAIIKQFHPRNTDGFVHPIWNIRVSDYGVSLYKNAIDDSVSDPGQKATWPVDSLVWHDIVFGIRWRQRQRGEFWCFLDGVPIHHERDLQIYPGATSGCWFSEGIYMPGGERDVERLTIYTQGFKQGYPGMSYEDVVGESPKSIVPVAYPHRGEINPLRLPK